MLNDLYFKPKRKTKPKWCRDCGRKHSRADACELELVKDLTVRRYDEDDELIFEGTEVGYYSKFGEKDE